MLKEFIERVEAAEAKGRFKSLTISERMSVAVKDFVKAALEARSKGGKNRHRNDELLTDPAAVRNREAVRRHRERKKNLTE